MQVDEVSRYFPAAQIDELPEDLSKPRHIFGVSAEQRRKSYDKCVAATEIWNAADTDAGRRAVLDAYKASGDVDDNAFKVLNMFLNEEFNRLPPAEIEYAMDQLGLTDEDNGVLSDVEKDSLDRNGYVNLGPLLDADQLQKMRKRFDAAIEEEGASPINAEKRGLVES